MGLRSSTTGTTRTEDVYGSLRAAILNGVFEPGQRLKLVDLGKRFEVSFSVVREALTRLSEQGLVVLSPQRGFSVVPLSMDDLADLTSVRIRIECMALRDAIENGTVAWEAAIVSSHYAMERIPMRKDDESPNEEWEECHRAFHQALLAACESPRLKSMADALRQSSDLYRTWAGSLAGDRTRDPAAEHQRLKELCLAREADAAAVALTEHIERASVVLLRWVAEHDGLGIDGAPAEAIARIEDVAAAQGGSRTRADRVRGSASPQERKRSGRRQSRQ